MSDTKDWPLVPVDPACVPEGYEAVRVGVPKEGEVVGWAKTMTRPAHNFESDFVRLIIRPIPKPIKLPVQIVPPGWWVWQQKSGTCHISKQKPVFTDLFWTDSTAWHIPPPIAAQLPAEYLALPWDQSLMQQTEGM